MGSCIGFYNNYPPLHRKSVGNHNESVAGRLADRVVVLRFIATTRLCIAQAVQIQRRSGKAPGRWGSCVGLAASTCTCTAEALQIIRDL